MELKKSFGNPQKEFAISGYMTHKIKTTVKEIKDANIKVVELWFRASSMSLAKLADYTRKKGLYFC